jgi:hypothetical protein
MKYTPLQMANWLWLGWARRFAKPGTVQANARVAQRLHEAYNRTEKANTSQAQIKSNFRWCPECMQCRAHKPGADQCIACDAKALEDTQFRCTVCGQIGTVGRCCGLETREPLNNAASDELAKAAQAGKEVNK